MERNILYIKNMVCNRCIKVVKEELEKLGLEIESIALGEVVLTNSLVSDQLEEISKVLLMEGFELLEDKNRKIIEKIKNIIIAYVHHDGEREDKRITFSELLSKELDKEYHFLSTLFSSVEGITIEHFLIEQKIERAKELLKYNELSLAEVAYSLGYSSVPHLSSQFKKITGLTVSQFRKSGTNTRKALDKI